MASTHCTGLFAAPAPCILMTTLDTGSLQMRAFEEAAKPGPEPASVWGCTRAAQAGKAKTLTAIGAFHLWSRAGSLRLGAWNSATPALPLSSHLSTESSNRLSLRFLAAPKQPARAHAHFDKASKGGRTWGHALSFVKHFHIVSPTL